MAQETSLKQLFQGMSVNSINIVEGEVISSEPLQVKLVNDEKMILEIDIMALPSHLTNRAVSCDISLPEGAVLSAITKTTGNHNHLYSGSYTSSDGDHVHELDTFSIHGAKINIYNSLNVGEKVYILSFNYGKQYYILDRV